MNSASKYLSAVFLAVTLITAVGCSSTERRRAPAGTPMTS